MPEYADPGVNIANPVNANFNRDGSPPQHRIQGTFYITHQAGDKGIKCFWKLLLKGEWSVAERTTFMEYLFKERS